MRNPSPHRDHHWLLQQGRGFYFTFTLILALSLMGCSLNQCSSNQACADDRQDENDDGDPVRVKELNKTREWTRFKSFWKHLDAVEPGHKSDTAYYFPLSYTVSDDHNWKFRMADSLGKALDEILPGLYSLTEKQLLDSAEVNLLKEVCSLRIEYIYTGFSSMITRMIPPPGQSKKEETITDLEDRIDLVLRLEKENKMDEAEINLAMDTINRKLTGFGILDILTRNFRYAYDSYSYGLIENDTSLLFQPQIDKFEKQRAEFLSKYDAAKADENTHNTYEAYQKTEAQLTSFKKILPQFGDLTRDLILND